MSRRTALAFAVVASLSAAACSSSAATSEGTTPSAPDSAATTVVPPTTTTAAAVAPSATAPYYVSLGDSYAAGYQAGLGATSDGFAYQVADQSQATSAPLQLVNFACAGATTSSILETTGCAPALLGPDAAPYDSQTQIEAAEAFLKAHPGEVGLITVSIGGNDVTPCGTAPDAASCATQAVAGVSANLTTLLTRLRAAAGPDV
ncbi:MAG TPA: SGNH/GDSL hydrolase family protein, partial [Acidimicrobiales bacterium]